MGKIEPGDTGSAADSDRIAPSFRPRSRHLWVRHHWRVTAPCLLLVLAVAAALVIWQRHNAALRHNRVVAQALYRESDSLRVRMPQAAVLLGIEAMRLDPAPKVRADLTTTLARTHYAGTLAGDDGPVWAVAFSPAGNVLATASADATVVLWRTLPGTRPTRLATISGYSSGVLSVAFSPDGKVLATGSGDATVLWNVINPMHPRRLATLTGDSGGVTAVDFSPDRRTLVTASSAGTVILWGIENLGSPVRQATLTDRGSSLLNSLTTVAFSADGHILAFGDNAGSTQLWNVVNPANPARLSIIKDHTTPANPAVRRMDYGETSAIAFSPDSHVLADAGVDGTVIMWNVINPAHPRRLRLLYLHDGSAINDLAFSPDGKLLATAARDGTVSLWNLTGPLGSWLCYLTGHSGSVNAVAFNARQPIVATGGSDQAVMLWNVPYGTSQVLKTLTNRPAGFSPVAFSPNGRVLVDASEDGTESLWDTTDPAHPLRLGSLTGQSHSSFSTSVKSPYSISFSPNGSILAIATSHGVVVLLNITGRKHPKEIAVLSRNFIPFSVVFSPNGHMLAAVGGTGKGEICDLWDVSEPTQPKHVGTLVDHADPAMFSVAYSPDGHTLATGGLFGDVVLWNITNPAHPRELSTLPYRFGQIPTVAFSPDGRILATGGNTTVLWKITDLSHPAKLATLNGQNAVSFSRDGHILATGSIDGSVMLWDVSDAVYPVWLTALSAHIQSPFDTISFSRNGQVLAAGGNGATAVWNITDLTNVPDLMKIACRIAGPGLGRTAWQRYIPQIPYQRMCG